MMHSANFVVFDIETGGLDESKSGMIEIALIVINSNLEIIDRYETLIKPYSGFGGVPLILYSQALQVNGIKETDLRNGKDGEVVFNELVALLKKYTVEKYKKPILVGHNIIDFDNKFLKYFFNLFGKKTQDDKVLEGYIASFYADTMWLSRMKWGNVEVSNHKLEGFCERLGVSHYDSHRAMSDAEANAEAFIKIMDELRSGAKSFEMSNEREQKRDFTF